MSKNAFWKGLLAIAIACGSVTPAWAQVTVAQVLTFKPKSDDVAYSTPTAAEIAGCTVEVVKGVGGGTGYLLSDKDKNKLRKFFDSDADGKVDTWSFYKDGVEVYRESIAGKGYSFRWIGPGGMKWGVGTVDGAGKARIEAWRMISAEEAAAEAFAALQTGDFERLKALMISPQEMQALGLPAAEVQRLTTLQTSAPAKFQKVRAVVANIAQAKFSRLESAAPGAYPADVTGGTQDIVKANGLILFENATAAKKHDWIQSHDIVQVGNAWRLTDVPSPENPVPIVDDKLKELLAELADIDKNQPQKKTPQYAAWIMQRVQKIEQLSQKADPKDQETWYKQIFDNLAGAVADDVPAAAARLTEWKDRVEKAMPGSNLAAYGVYRELFANYQRDMNNIKQARELPPIQDRYFAGLEKFIESYPKSEDTSDAMNQLANGSEFSGKEDIAKKWYTAIVKDHPTSPNAVRAAGAIRRIDSIGKNFELAGPTLAGGAYKLNPGKITVVYYWASYSGQVVGDFATLKKLQQEAIGKDFEIVTVSLDDKAADATAFLAKTPISATTLHQPGANGGTDSKLATDYGIFGLPHLFLIDRDGKVVNNKAQVNGLEDEIGRLTAKK